MQLAPTGAPWNKLAILSHLKSVFLRVWGQVPNSHYKWGAGDHPLPPVREGRLPGEGKR